MNGSVSVALCSHNGARYIESQLRSILEQSMRPAEVVLSDDASTDDTVSLARAVMASAPEVVFTVLENRIPLGVTANFEQAVRACTGELIVLSDQDDLWHPDRVSCAAAEFDARPGLTLLFADARLVGPNGESLGRDLFEVLEVGPDHVAAVHNGQGFSLFIRRNVATGATVMFRRGLLQSALPFGADWVHDGWLATMATIVGTVDVIEHPLIDYRQHSSNQIGVEYPTLRRKVARMLMPRGERNARLARMAAQLLERVASLQRAIPADLVDAVREKAEFEALREALPPLIPLRIRPILALDRRGWYNRYASQGRIDMLRDLLQPHR